MAYNLQPLITILEQILDPQQTCFIHDENKPQLKSLLQKAISLQHILEIHPLPNIKISLEREIRDAAHKAEDIIESRMVRQIRSRNLIGGWLIKWCKCFTFSLPHLQPVMQQLDSAMEQVVKLVQVEEKKMISSRGTSSLSSGAAFLNPKSASAKSKASTVVGFDEDLMELKDRLTGMQRKLEIIPIVGMGGAGKTTLARNLYQDPLTVSHFVARAWTTVSQDHDMRTILLSLLSCMIKKDQHAELIKKQVIVDELKDILYKSLFGRRYLIVLDDIWSTQVWDEMRMFVPDNNNGSRVVITTRESNVAKYANSQSWQHEVQLLSESASWDLLRQIVFGEDDCPLVLEPMGRKMVTDCGGLPLAITVIGGLLSKVERSKEVWENIGENVRAAIAKSEEGEQYSNIMSLSYKHLPNYLKPCFLYMGAFPEDYEIKGSILIFLWMAEGFVKSNINGSDKSLEEEAEGYLKGLVERNLLMVRRNKSNGKAMSYIIHDVLRDLCIRKADEDNFRHVLKNDHVRGVGISKLRRMSNHHHSYGIEGASTKSFSLTRSFLCTRLYEIVICISSVSNLLRVLDIMQMYLPEFPKEILQLVNLRYLAVDCDSFPVEISRLLNLQTLIADLLDESVPSEIWTMSELRHLKLIGGFIWSKDDEIKELVQLNKLQTISGYLKLSESLHERGFLQTIPNIKYLGIYWEGHSEIDFSHLHKLETLRYRSYNEIGGLFPPSLRKLTLCYCVMNWRTTSTLCGLPNLEVLKLHLCKFNIDATNTQEWESREGEEFRSLQFLHLHNLKLVRWRADETNFPKLRHLLVEDCPRLEEIPSCIGEIPTLELIEMKKCSASAVESAKQIVEVQQSDYGNYALQLRILYDDNVVVVDDDDDDVVDDDDDVVVVDDITALPTLGLGKNSSLGIAIDRPRNQLPMVIADVITWNRFTLNSAYQHEEKSALTIRAVPE